MIELNQSFSQVSKGLKYLEIKYNTQRNKYKTTSTSKISRMCIRRVNIWWTYSIEGYKQNKPETKIPL